MSSSSFKGGLTLVESSTIGNKQRERESCRGFEKHTVGLDEESKIVYVCVCVYIHTHKTYHTCFARAIMLFFFFGLVFNA